MNSKLWIRQVLSTCLCFVVLTTYSMVGLANTGKIAGEIVVSGKSVDGESPTVSVNGTAAKSGRSIFSSSVISTPENTSAVVNMGKAGKVELAPNSTLALSFDDKAISGELTSGTLTVLSSSAAVNITTTDGKTVSLTAGQSVMSNGEPKDDDKDTVKSGGSNWWILAVVLGGAAAGIVYAATQADNKVDVGGTGVVVSPGR